MARRFVLVDHVALGVSVIQEPNLVSLESWGLYPSMNVATGNV